MKKSVQRIIGRIHNMMQPGVLRHEAAIALDRLRGINFARHEDFRITGLDPERSTRYEPSDSFYLQRVLGDVGVTSSDSILDVGCGKGAALKIMSRFPFHRICGIELSAPLVSIARNNFRRLGMKDIEIVHADALEYHHYPDFSIIYMYNPFPSAVMRPFIRLLADAIIQNPAFRLLIYSNPVCHDDVVAGNRLVLTGSYPGCWDKEINLYRVA